jgi:hypothetical protein
MAFSDFWNQLKQSPSFRPTRLYIKPQQTDKEDTFFASILPNKHYFTVRINEVFLSYSRKWLVTYDPLVFTVAEFTYDGKKVTIPYAVGATMMKGKMEKVPEGMVFQDTRVAGLHPYAGGPMALSMVLCRVEQTKYLQRLIDVIEGASSTYTAAFATIINDYVKIAGVVMKGFESLMGLEETQALVGFRREFDVDAGDDFKAGYYALFNADGATIDESKLWVLDNRLCYGDTAATAKAFRTEDYVLYSITASTNRFDEKSLPFYAYWINVSSYANQLSQIDEDAWKIIKAKMFALNDMMRLSPDLVPGQAAQLFEEYKNEILKIRASKNILSDLESFEAPSDWEKSAMDVLNM